MAQANSSLWSTRKKTRRNDSTEKFWNRMLSLSALPKCSCSRNQGNTWTVFRRVASPCNRRWTFFVFDQVSRTCFLVSGNFTLPGWFRWPFTLLQVGAIDEGDFVKTALISYHVAFHGCLKVAWNVLKWFETSTSWFERPKSDSNV